MRSKILEPDRYWFQPKSPYISTPLINAKKQRCRNCVAINWIKAALKSRPWHRGVYGVKRSGLESPSRDGTNRFDRRIGSNRFDGRIENQWGSIRPWSRRPVASHCTAYNSSDYERKLRKMLSELYILLSYLRHCVFTANRIEEYNRIFYFRQQWP